MNKSFCDRCGSKLEYYSTSDGNFILIGGTLKHPFCPKEYIICMDCYDNYDRRRNERLEEFFIVFKSEIEYNLSSVDIANRKDSHE